jgi:hypothetical protein
MSDGELTDERLRAAIEAVSGPGRLRDAEALVSRAAPDLQRVLGLALAEGGWFDTAHNASVKDAVSDESVAERMRRVKVLTAEETRLAMLVGVAVGFELARELGLDPTHPEPQED